MPALDFMGNPGYQYLSLLWSDSSFSNIYTAPPNLDPLSIRIQVPVLAWHFLGLFPRPEELPPRAPLKG